jgi:phage recombination protein Bet
MTTALVTLTSKLAARLEMGDGTGLVDILKATAFKGPATDAQLTALMVVANQYGLNPWTREIYAFPDKNNGIVPVVGVDGWSRIINTHPQYDGMEFEQDSESCTCIIHRKDRGHPTRVTEYMVECRRPSAGPWISHPYRMLRHKAMIQCARLAFGFVGIYEQDEAERIVESIDTNTGEIVNKKPAVAMPQSKAREPADTDVTDVQEKPQSNGEPATAGEIAYMTKRIANKAWSIADAMEAAGMPGVDTLDGLTKDGFAALKEATK